MRPSNEGRKEGRACARIRCWRSRRVADPPSPSLGPFAPPRRLAPRCVRRTACEMAGERDGRGRCFPNDGCRAVEEAAVAEGSVILAKKCGGSATSFEPGFERTVRRLRSFGGVATAGAACAPACKGAGLAARPFGPTGLAGRPLDNDLLPPRTPPTLPPP